MNTRLSRNEVYFGMAVLMGARSTCPRANVGAVAVKDRRIIATGYVGSPSRQPHCLDVGCDIVDGHCMRTIHAEANLIAFAAKHGVSLEGSTIYVTHSPCTNCAKLLINAGVQTVNFIWIYDTAGVNLLTDSGVHINQAVEEMDWVEGLGKLVECYQEQGL